MRWVRRYGDGRGGLLRDGLLWAVVAAPIGFPRLTPPYGRYALPLGAGALALLAVAVWLSHRRPLPALVLVVLGSLVDGNFVFAIPVFSYLTGRRSSGAAPTAVVFGLIAAGGTALNVGLLGAGAATWFLLASVLLFAGVFPWLVGRYRRQQEELVVAGSRHAEAVERERRGAAERIRLRERARIAQEMHDSLGHELSLIALRAAALELAGDLPARHRAAAGELRASVAGATERLHEIIGVLREEGGTVSTRPAGESVAELVGRAREAGMAVRLDGDPGGLPAMVGRAAHGMVREALTNAARYAPGAPVTVTVARAGDRVEVGVVNAAPPAGPLPGPPSTGSGLLALAERVRLAGGTLRAGPRDGGGFAVGARLPLPSTADPDALAPGAAPDAPPVAPSDTPPSRAFADGLDGTRPDVPGRPGSYAERFVLAGKSVRLTQAVDPSGLDPDWADGPSARPAEAERRLREARRRVRRSLAAALGAPAILGLVLTLVYYPFATAGAVLDAPTFERLPLGAARQELTGLPRRQADPPTTGDSPGCEYYTDGNFPFAQATWRLCFADGRLVSKERVAG
ncbi:sensor histidine kinase [Micromonospora olivasterospora]|uniref:histidine kinase n=1 Tax=Micromonospora olivasterospora TaxID=1880 RepID=A0A562IDU1_MICOL|nr:sensor histidine kinase [Micromonospora olivasterospora]TWH69130.1 signal transduction histidine kinase [Micromonospora olivasterospora]